MQADVLTITDWKFNEPEGKESDRYDNTAFYITGTINETERTFGPTEDPETFTMLECIPFKWSKDELRDEIRCELADSNSALYNELNSHMFTCAVRFSEPSTSLDKPKGSIFYMSTGTIYKVTIDHPANMQPLKSGDFDVYFMDRDTQQWLSIQRRIPDDGIIGATMYFDRVFDYQPRSLFLWQLIDEKLLSSEVMKANIELDETREVYNGADPLDYPCFLTAGLPGAQELHEKLVKKVIEAKFYSDDFTEAEIADRIYEDLRKDRESTVYSFSDAILELLGIVGKIPNAEKETWKLPFFSKSTSSTTPLFTQSSNSSKQGNKRIQEQKSQSGTMKKKKMS